MRCVARNLPTLTRFRVPALLPPDAYGLLRGDFFATPAWYDTVVEHGLPAGAEPIFVNLQLAGRSLAVLPMQRTGRRVGALTTPYTSLWRPQLAPGLGPMELRQLGQTFGAWAAGFGTVRLDCLEPRDPSWAHFLRGAREAGCRALPFDHFGNWHAVTAGISWDAYLAALPGALRESIRRRTRQLEAQAATCRLITGGAELEPAIAAYEAVYAKSWKQAEPFPQFNANLMRACAAAGTLRLGLLELAGTPIAAQFWVKRDLWAGVLKLAHDEAHKAASPGTVLTAFMIRHLLEAEAVHELDFGRGDDPYKRDWAPLRRQRGGIILANPLRPAGALAVVRAFLGRVIKRRK